jgi:RNA polymerase sigma-70 factor (ECF subfamily)
MSATFDPAELLAHAEGVRALARRLAGDDHAGDDVVQEACLVALTHPPAAGTPRRAWFVGVVRHLVHRLRRGDSRRSRRERAVARPAAVQPSAQAASEIEAHRLVVEAVAALADPYRTAIVFRFLDDLTPREIAARLGVPDATVRTWIHRGLGMLRARLASERDDRLAALAPLFAVRRGAPLPSATAVAGGVVMTKATVAVIAIVVGLAAGMLLDRGLVSAPLREPGGDSAVAAPSPTAAPSAGRTRTAASPESADAGPAPAATAPSATAVASNDAAVRAQVMKTLDGLDGDWRKTYAAGRELAKLDSAIVLSVLRERWKSIQEPGDRWQILKAFREPPAPANILDVLDLGMSDPSAPVQSAAILFLREYAGRDFGTDWNAYAPWRAANAGRTPHAVLQSAVREIAERMRAATPEEMTRLVSAAADVNRAASGEDLLRGGLPEAIEPWITRVPAKSLYPILGVLSKSRPGEEYLRRTVVPLLTDQDVEKRDAAFWFFMLENGRDAWAFDVLSPFLRDPDPRAVVGAIKALGGIGDPRAIEPLLDLLRAHPAPDAGVEAGAALSKITGVRFDRAQDSAWWDAWWAKNRERFQTPR